MPGTTTATPAAIAVGTKVRLKAVQESAYLPQTLLDYLERNELGRTDAVFTVTSIFDGDRDTMVDFAELDTRGGYYLRRFEVAEQQPTVSPGDGGFTITLTISLTVKAA